MINNAVQILLVAISQLIHSQYCNFLCKSFHPNVYIRKGHQGGIYSYMPLTQLNYFGKRGKNMIQKWVVGERLFRWYRRPPENKKDSNTNYFLNKNQSS